MKVHPSLSHSILRSTPGTVNRDDRNEKLFAKMHLKSSICTQTALLHHQKTLQFLQILQIKAQLSLPQWGTRDRSG